MGGGWSESVPRCMRVAGDNLYSLPGRQALRAASHQLVARCQGAAHFDNIGQSYTGGHVQLLIRVGTTLSHHVRMVLPDDQRVARNGHGSPLRGGWQTDLDW